MEFGASSLAITIVLQLYIHTSGETFKWDSYCHQMAEHPQLMARLTSSIDDAVEWCVIIPDNDVYLQDVSNKIDDPKYPYVIDMLKVRQLCRKFDATLIDIDFKENTTKSTAVKKVLDVLEGQQTKKRQLEYPLDCAYEFDSNLNKHVPACDKGRLPDNYEYYIMYVHSHTKGHPFLAKEKMYTEDKAGFTKKFYYVCYQKVKKVETGRRSHRSDSIDHISPVSMEVSFLLLLILHV